MLSDIARNHQTRQKFTQQQHENELVLQVRTAAPCWPRQAWLHLYLIMMQELELLEEDSNIYKLIGPVLIRQDPLEAKSNVKKRLEFIQGELDRVDSQLKKLEDKSAKRQAAVRIASNLLPCNCA